MKIHKGGKDDLENEVVKLISNKLSLAIKENGQGILAVPGGSSVIGIFNKLRSVSIDWKNIHIFLVDERWVEYTYNDSNYKNLKENLLDYIDIPEENVYIFSTDKGVDDYQEQFMKYGRIIDVCLLGTGEDGHVGSLFPNHPSIEDDSSGYIEVNESPKLPPRRISLSKKSILESKSVILVIFGEGKLQALTNLMNDELSIFDCPAKVVKDSFDSHLFTDINS